MPYRLEWKNALFDYLNAPYEDDINTPAIPEPKTRYQALQNIGNIFLYALIETVKATIPVLKRMLFNYIQKDNDENFNRRLDAIEIKSRIPIPRETKPAKSRGEKLTDASTNNLFKFKYKSDKLKSFILLNMIMVYFDADQEQSKKFIINNCYDLLVQDEAFAHCLNDEFKIYFKNIVIHLIEQTDTYAEAFLKYKSSIIIKHLGFYNKDKRYFAETFFTDSCGYAQSFQLANYQLDRVKAKAFYSKVQGYKQSKASAKIDACAKMLYITSAIFLLSMGLGIDDYPILGYMSAAVSGLIFTAYLKEFLWEATAATEAFAMDYTNKIHDFLEIKLVENKSKQIFEFKLESHIPQDPLPERSVAPLPLSWRKIPKKKAPSTTPAEVGIAASITSGQSSTIEKRIAIADTQENIYYHLANNSFFRFNANELNQNRESINNPKLSLASIMQNILEKSNAIGSTDSKADGIKFVGPNEKGVDPKKYPLKFKFKGAPYGSLRIALTTRNSRPDETTILEGQTTINSPALFYRH